MKTPLLLGAAALAIAAAGCKPSGASPKTPSSGPPAKVLTENDLALVVLKPEAEQRLGIATEPVAMRKVERNRLLGGELLLPLGRAARGATAGTNASPSIYALLPAMTPAELVRVAEMQVDADGQIAAARVQLESAEIALTRAKSLLASKAGTQRAVDEAQTQARLAETALETARERRALLGAPVFEAVRQDVLWARVTVYAGDLDQINRAGSASVSSLSPGTNRWERTARPVDVPISAAGAAATVDLFYELDNAGGSLRAGQRVNVSLPMLGNVESLVVPKAAVLYDIHGGNWVYENTAPHTFTRRRIEVRFNHDTGVVLARGPQAGARVVTEGAAELFGIEFGIGK